MKFTGLAIGIILIPFHFGFGQTLEVLPDEIAPGVPKMEMMAEWLKKQAIVSLDQRDAAFEKLETDDDLKKWQDERRAFFVRQLGGFPERTPLNPKVTGELTIDDYRIEKLYFESQPGLHVTATLYLPLGKGPFPAVLHPTGHSASAKNRELYQQASIVIVKGGCAVLCYDPIGQGERQQVYGTDGKPIVSTMQHSLIDQGAHLLGSNTARIMIWDGMRAIDYLQSRPDILADKIGCTGISGGGTNTSYLMALDDRIVAAAPGCYLTGFRSLLNTIGPQDAEQNIHGQIAFGMDHSDYVLMHLPKPILIMAATGDYFDIKGAWNLFRDGKRFATWQGYPERINLIEPNTEHGFPTEMRLASANWMRRWLLDLDKPISEGVLKPFPEAELNATPNGKVLELECARTAFDLNADWNEDFAARRAENAKPENRDALLAKIRQLIGARDLADLPLPKMKKVDKGRLVIEPEPGILLPGHLIGIQESKEDLTIYLHGAGARAAIESGGANRVVQKAGMPVLAIDLRGLGETKRTVERPRISDELVGTDRKDTWLASLMGKTYVGMRAEDIWQIVRAMRKETGNETLKPHLIAVGEAAIPALHAAALEPGLFGDVRISGSIDSWTAVVETPVVRNQQSNLVFGALREYDLPMLRALLGEQLTIHGSVNPDGTHAANTPAVPRSTGKMGRHLQINRRVSEGNVNLIFIGDSITSGWESRGAEVWDKFYGKRNAVNLGIGGDRTQHVSWRLDNGNLKDISPKAAVVMIGTNNSRDNTSERIAEGVKLIIEQLRTKLPDTNVLLLGIFPRGENNDERRQVVQKANAIISKFADGKHVHYLDIGPKFMNDDGALIRGMMPDMLHLTGEGYAIWAESIEADLSKLLGDKPVKPTPTESVALWPGNAPVGNGKFEDSDLELEVFLPPADKANGAAIVLCPGGGYIRHVTDREGYPIAQWLSEHGIATIILEYRLPKLRHQVPLLDAQRAIRLTRANAAAWKIDPKRIGILGFSAGGHVASTAATHFDNGNTDSPDPIERLSCRPDFAWLVYPVVTMGKYTNTGSKAELLGPDPKPELVRLYSNETQVTAETPPTFLAHAVDDKPVPPENSRQFVAAMKTQRVSVELLELPSGGHGFNGCKGPLWEQWKAAALKWLAGQKLPAATETN